MLPFLLMVLSIRLSNLRVIVLLLYCILLYTFLYSILSIS